MGLPCPNIFVGGLNFHGRYEFIPIPSMEKAVKVIVKIAELVTSHHSYGTKCDANKRQGDCKEIDKSD